MNEVKMLSCEEALRMLFAYLDGELEDSENHDVGQHLQACRSCFSRAEFEKRLKSHLGELRAQPVPAEFESRIRSLIRQFEC